MLFLSCLTSTAPAHLRSVSAAQDGTLQLHIVEEGSKDPLPSRVRIYGPARQGLKSQDICDGVLELFLPPGRYRIVVERGPEYVRGEDELWVEKEEVVRWEIQLRRRVDLARKGWWSGETHVHLPPHSVKHHMLAEDLHLVPVITMWNERRSAGLELPLEDPLVEVEPTRVYHLGSYEHEPPGIGGNAVIYFNLRRPLRYDENMVVALYRAKEEGAWAEIEKPYIRDTPALLATRQVDSIEIAPNALSWWLKDDFLTPEDSPPRVAHEKWGRPRDKKTYPGLKGFGLYIQDLYYRVLNCGFRIPPTAGTSCGHPQMPVGLGYNRVYVRLGEGFSYEAWWRQLAAGRVFVTNGPLLLVRANGALPGEVFHLAKTPAFEVQLDIGVTGNDPVEAVEVVRDGRVVQRIEGENLQGRVDVDPLVFDQSGWFLVRAFAGVPFDGLRFASTGPFYVEMGDNPRRVHRADAEYMLRWVEERTASLRERYKGDPQREYYLRPHQQARQFFERLSRDLKWVDQ